MRTRFRSKCHRNQRIEGEKTAGFGRIAALEVPNARHLIAYNDLPSTTETDILFLLD